MRVDLIHSLYGAALGNDRLLLWAESCQGHAGDKNKAPLERELMYVYSHGSVSDQQKAQKF